MARSETTAGESPRPWRGVLAGVVVVLLGVAAVGGFVAYQVKNDFHHTTLAASFAGDTELLLVRPTHLPTQRGGMDLWWVSASTGKVLKHAREEGTWDQGA